MGAGRPVRRGFLPLLAAALGVLLLGGPLAAQAWDTPSFLPPRSGDELGGYLVQPGGADWGVAGIWRQAGNVNLGVRAGVVQPAADGADLRYTAGAETWGVLMSRGRDFPLDVAWTLGAGATFGDATLLRVPAGFSVGLPISTRGLTLVPYAHPRVALDVLAVDDASDTSFRVLADLGLDIHLGLDAFLRVGVSVGEGGDALGVGVAVPMGRRLEVR